MASIRQLYVTLSLRADEYTNKLRAAQKETAEFNKTISPVTKALDNVGKAATAAGGVLSAGLTAPIVAIGVLSTKAAREFESSFAGVRKTVDATDEEFKKLSTGLRDMSKELPVNVNELNRIAEAAGQLGVKKEDILQFTKTMAMLGETTNLSSDEAATAIAQFQNRMGTAGQDVDKFAATLVGLGNAGASTEKDIVEMGLRIAGAGKTVGLTQAQVLSLAAGLADIGIKSEAGGSAMSRVLLKMQDAVKGGGAALDEFSRIAGTNFKKAFEQDASQAVALFTQGLGRLDKSGENINRTVEGVIGKNIILKDTLLSLKNGGDKLNETIQRGNGLWIEGTAHTHEFGERMKTFDSQWGVFKNRLNDVAITLGQALLPALSLLLQSLNPLIDAASVAAEWFGKLPAPIQLLGIVLAALAAAAGPALLAFGFMASSIAALTPVVVGLTAILPEIAVVLLSLTGPIAVVVGALAGLAVAFSVFPELKGLAIDVLGDIQDAMEALWQSLSSAWSKIKSTVVTAVTEIQERLSAWWKDQDSLRSTLAALWTEVTSIFKTSLAGITIALEAASVTIQALWVKFGPDESMFTFAVNTVAAFINNLVAALSTGIQVATGLIQAFHGLITLDFKKWSEGIQTIWNGLWDGIARVTPAGISQFAESMKTSLGTAADQAERAAGNVGKFSGSLQVMASVYGEGEAAAEKARKANGGFSASLEVITSLQFDDKIRKLEAEAAKYNLTVDRGTKTQEQYIAALQAAITQHKALGGGLDSTADKTKKAADEAKKAADEWNKMKDAFKDSLAPADALHEKIEILQNEFGDSAVLKVYRDQIIQTVESQKEMGLQVTSLMADFYALAKAEEASIAVDKEIQELINERTKRQEKWNDTLEKSKVAAVELKGPLIQLTDEANAMALGMSGVAVEVDRSNQAYLESHIELGKMRGSLTEVTDRINSMRAAGSSNSAILNAMSGDITKAAETARKLGINLDSTTLEMLELLQSQEKAAAVRKKFEDAFSGIVDGLVNMISQFKFSLSGLGDLAKSAASQMLKAFTDQLFSPIKDAIAGLGRDLAGGLSKALFGSVSGGASSLIGTGVNTAGGGILSGLLSKIPGLSGLLGGAAAAAPNLAAGIALPGGTALLSAGVATGTAGAAAAGAGTAAAVGGTAAGGAGLAATLTGLATNPITIAAAGAIVAGLLIKNKVGQGRETADIFVKEVQNAFSTTGDQWFKGLQNIIDPITRARESGTLTSEMVQTAIADLEKDWDTFNKIAQSFIDAKAGVGGKEQLVVDQAFATLNPIMDRFREDLSGDLVKLKRAAEEQAESAQSAADDVSDATDKMGTSVRDGFKVFDKAVDKFMEAVMKFVAAGMSTLKTVADTTKAAVADAVKTVAPTTEQTTNASGVIGDITGRVRTVDQALADMANTIAESSGNWLAQSRMANPGLSPQPSIGQTFTMQPASQQVMIAPVYGPSIHIEIHTTGDERKIAQAVEQVLASNQGSFLDHTTKAIKDNWDAV